ncbi:MAG: anaerobic ribonucleoside-triphosphate reductase activating protein [Desulfurococcaceae archaeon]
MNLLTAGWKNVSLIDVYGYTSFTIWTCSCNLRCPFCHNYRLAEKDPSLCREINIGKIVEELETSKHLVDYLHVTGGEPLLQHRALGELYREAGSMGIKRSLNSNLTLPSQLRYLLEEDLVDHVATDLKIPPIDLYGLNPNIVEIYWRRFLESLDLVREHGVKLELRIPVSRKLTPGVLEKYINEVENKLNVNNTLVLLNPLLGEPYVKPRNPAWCRENCNVSENEVRTLVDILKSKGFSKIVIKTIPGL